MRSTFSCKLGILVFCAAIASCTGCRNKETAADPTTRNITIAQWGQARYLIYLPVYLAQSQGFFAKHRINTDIVFSGNDDQVFATVARGDAQFGVGDPIFTAISTERGLPGVEVATIVGRVALWGVGRKGARPIKKPEDLSGLRIGTYPRPSTTYTLLADTLRRSHVNARITEVQIGSELALLESNAVDLVFLLEPDASIAESKGYPIAMSLPAMWGEFAFTGLTTTRQFATSNPALVGDFQSAIADAVHFAHDNQPATISAAQKLFPQIDPAVIVSSVERMIREDTLPTSAEPDKEGWQRAVLVRQEVGDLRAGSDYLNCLWNRH